MRIAVFSDIHANYHAFKACYRDALTHGANSFILLGDYVSDLADPQRTMDLVYEIISRYPTFCLRGNRERYMLEYANGERNFTQGSKTGSLLFTFNQLREKDLAFFKSLRIADEIELHGVRFEIAHAIPGSDQYYFDNQSDNIGDVLAHMNCNYLLTGHSHKQYILEESGKTIMNPGSVGIPHGGSPWPKYALLEPGKDNVSCIFREVPYDLTETIHAQFTSGLVALAGCWAIGVLNDLITGEERLLALLQRVMKTNCSNNEKIWCSIANEMGMKFTEEEFISAINDFSIKYTVS